MGEFQVHHAESKKPHYKGNICHDSIHEHSRKGNSGNTKQSVFWGWGCRVTEKGHQRNLGAKERV